MPDAWVPPPELESLLESACCGEISDDAFAKLEASLNDEAACRWYRDLHLLQAELWFLERADKADNMAPAHSPRSQSQLASRCRRDSARSHPRDCVSRSSRQFFDDELACGLSDRDRRHRRGFGDSPIRTLRPRYKSFNILPIRDPNLQSFAEGNRCRADHGHGRGFRVQGSGVRGS